MQGAHVRFSGLLFAQEPLIIMAGMSNGNSVAVIRVHGVYDWDASSHSQVGACSLLCCKAACLQALVINNFFYAARICQASELQAFWAIFMRLWLMYEFEALGHHRPCPFQS